MRVLILKINSVGDVVMTLPLVHAVREAAERGQITWVCGTEVAPLLMHFGGIDKLVVVDERKFFGTLGVLPSVCELAKLCTWLVGRSYDLVAIGHRDSRFRLLSRIVRSAERRSFSWNWPVPGRYYPNELVRLITGADGPDISRHICQFCGCHFLRVSMQP